MIIRRKSIPTISFGDLGILDYTAGLGLSSSIACIQVPPGARHALSWSTRSDKYYYVLSGRIDFGVEGEETVLDQGDVCVIVKGQRFRYGNHSDEPVDMILFHTPSFVLEAERFEALGDERS